MKRPAMHVIIYALAVTICLLLFSSLPAILSVQMGGDWFGFFRPRALHIEDPYAVGPTAYVPWAFVPLIPIAALPGTLGYGLLWTCSLMVLTAFTKQWWRALLLVLCWPVLDGLQLGQVDALFTIALMMPPNWALVVALAKPVVLLPWALRRALNTRTYLVLETAIWISVFSFVLWPGWIVRISGAGLGTPYPQIAEAWPYLVPLGLILLTRKKEGMWLWGAALITPYLSPYHLTPALAYLYRQEERWWVLALITAATWLPVLIGG